ncbi:hypothetical protein [Spirillospora sp. NPDC047279]|uniref:hypothetical protein n=1 Tax=Spirillospora sp. NPDC047279 TaxID=3155478 RepID=UPI0033FC72B2
MTGAGFEVSPDRVRSSGLELKSIADRLADAAKQFQAEVAGFGEPWGGDDIGMIIGLAHGAVFEAAVECFTDNASEIMGRAEQVGQVADGYDQMEDANLLYVNRIGDVL